MQTNIETTLTQDEKRFLQHTMMWGSDSYPVHKVGRTWRWMEAGGIGGSPVAFKTKRECVAAVERYLCILRDKYAGRVQS